MRSGPIRTESTVSHLILLDLLVPSIRQKAITAQSSRILRESFDARINSLHLVTEDMERFERSPITIGRSNLVREFLAVH
jgi:hypothetical protein